MSKIIKHGELFLRKIICPTCGCEFKIKNGEIKIDEQKTYNVPEEFRDYNGGKYKPVGLIRVNFVCCPDCGTNIYL